MAKACILVKNVQPKTRYAIAVIRKDIIGAQCLTNRNLDQVAKVESDADIAFLGGVDFKQTSVWLATLNLNRHHTQFKLDTGAEVTAVRLHLTTTTTRDSQLYSKVWGT